MAVFSKKCGNVRFVIHDQDHSPPHCHVKFVKKREVKVNLLTLETMKIVMVLPPNVRNCLRRLQEEMLEAWDDVTIMGEEES